MVPIHRNDHGQTESAHHPSPVMPPTESVRQSDGFAIGQSCRKALDQQATIIARCSIDCPFSCSTARTECIPAWIVPRGKGAAHPWIPRRKLRCMLHCNRIPEMACLICRRLNGSAGCSAAWELCTRVGSASLYCTNSLRQLRPRGWCVAVSAADAGCDSRKQRRGILDVQPPAAEHQTLPRRLLQKTLRQGLHVNAGLLQHCGGLAITHPRRIDERRGVLLAKRCDACACGIHHRSLS